MAIDVAYNLTIPLINGYTYFNLAIYLLTYVPLLNCNFDVVITVLDIVLSE